MPRARERFDNARLCLSRSSDLQVWFEAFLPEYDFEKQHFDLNQTVSALHRVRIDCNEREITWVRVVGEPSQLHLKLAPAKAEQLVRVTRAEKPYVEHPVHSGDRPLRSTLRSSRVNVGIFGSVDGAMESNVVEASSQYAPRCQSAGNKVLDGEGEPGSRDPTGGTAHIITIRISRVVIEDRASGVAAPIQVYPSVAQAN